jgi:hypothetical protein
MLNYKQVLVSLVRVKIGKDKGKRYFCKKRNGMGKRMDERYGDFNKLGIVFSKTEIVLKLIRDIFNELNILREEVASGRMVRSEFDYYIKTYIMNDHICRVKRIIISANVEYELFINGRMIKHIIKPIFHIDSVIKDSLVGDALKFEINNIDDRCANELMRIAILGKGCIYLKNVAEGTAELGPNNKDIPADLLLQMKG